MHQNTTQKSTFAQSFKSLFLVPAEENQQQKKWEMKTCTRRHTENTHKNVMYACMRLHTHGARNMEQYEQMQSTRQTLLMTLNLNTFLHIYMCCIGSQALFNGNVIISFRIVACLLQSLSPPMCVCTRGSHETIS